MRVRRFLQTPKGTLLVVLVPLAALAAAGEGVARVAPGLAAAMLSAGIIDGAVLRWKKRRWCFLTAHCSPD
jgi:hypothetical protein